MTNTNGAGTLVERVAYLLWQVDQGYILTEDRAIGTNWFAEPVEQQHVDDQAERPGWISMAELVIDLVKNEMAVEPPDAVEAPLSPGDYIVVYWFDGNDHQSAAGFFDHYGYGNGVTWLHLDWGFAVLTTADNFRWERADPSLLKHHLTSSGASSTLPIL